MAKTAVALYDSKNEAQLVKDELTNAGFSRSSIRMMDSGDSDAIDTLTNAGLPRNDADAYFEGMRRGGHLVMITTDDDQIDLVVDIMDRYNSVNIQERAEMWRSEGWGSQSGQSTMQSGMQETTGRQSAISGNQGRTGAIHDDQDQVAIPVVEEELQVGKRQVQKGGIRVHTHVEEKPVEESVTVRDEHINVQRRPVNRTVQPGDLEEIQEGTFEISEMDEEVVVDKQARVVEEVVVGKEVEERQERVRDTVRRTDVDVEPIDGRTTSNNTGNIDSSYTTGFRNHYNTNFAGSGRGYEAYEPAYQYGYNLRNNSKIKGRSWADVEAQARTDWERNHKGTWENFKDAIRHGWESMKR
ncbi:MAG: DUF2382 domain-containing protein [Caldilinea sp. CFX5]|nr:DUF2382 domain-containing protein [Caldilinea sp. CFX5]